MLLFEDELDENTSRILDSTECDMDNEGYSDAEDLNLENPELYPSRKRKGSTIKSDSPPNKKTRMNLLPPM